MGANFSWFFAFLGASCALCLLLWKVPWRGLRAQRDSVLQSQELARTSGHYFDKNNRNLVRSQKICFLFTTLVATKCDVAVWGSFHFRF